MIKKKEEKVNNIIEIDLTGPDGNVFNLMALVKNLSLKMGKEYNSLITEMTSGDYENAINVIEREFGSIVVMYR